MKFCGQCGLALVISCPRCGSENRPDNNFCGSCAAPLDYAQLDRHKDATAIPSGELKRVSMLFCDLVDSTRMAERLGPEKMHELVRWFIDTALAAVSRYEGTVPQFSGDGSPRRPLGRAQTMVSTRDRAGNERVRVGDRQ